jgi:hypothetical protein
MGTKKIGWTYLDLGRVCDAVVLPRVFPRFWTCVIPRATTRRRVARHLVRPLVSCVVGTGCPRIASLPSRRGRDSTPNESSQIGPTSPCLDENDTPLDNAFPRPTPPRTALDPKPESQTTQCQGPSHSETLGRHCQWGTAWIDSKSRAPLGAIPAPTSDCSSTSGFSHRYAAGQELGLILWTRNGADDMVANVME